jgi:1-deoxy-D-xylulose-5-phosphate reductoisomerase
MYPMVPPAAYPESVRRVAVLGSTGSIGTSALDVVRHFPKLLTVHALAAHSNIPKLAEQCREFKPAVAIITDAAAFAAADRSQFPTETVLQCGREALNAVAASADVDTVLSAIVGIAGLQSTWAAVEAGKTVAIANKETLVVAGPLIMALAAKAGATLLPVDSEHSAIAQCLGTASRADIRRVILTGSGGPFRGKTALELETVTVEAALKHPTWQMGPKITIDSATLMNKALEVIEARWLFDLPVEKIDVVIHPESIVHSFVEFEDGSTLAQLSPPDMKLPIQLALLHPRRVSGPAKRLDWLALNALHFEQPDSATFPALALGFDAAHRGGTVGAVLNAANEAAVEAFLAGGLGFAAITRAVQAVVANHHYESSPSLERLNALDRWARQEVDRWTSNRIAK